MPKRPRSQPDPPAVKRPFVEVEAEKKYDTVVSSGQSALRALLTMNGGAVVVFLTFISHLMEKETRAVQPDTMRLFVWAFAWFIGGIVLTLMSYGSIFITNCYSRVERPVASDRMFYVTAYCGFGSLVCFVGGGVTAVIAFRSVANMLTR